MEFDNELVKLHLNKKVKMTLKGDISYFGKLEELKGDFCYLGFTRIKGGITINVAEIKSIINIED